MWQHCACKPTWSYGVRMLLLCLSIQPDLWLDSSAFFLFACLIFFLFFFYWCSSTIYIVVFFYVLTLRRKSLWEFTKNGEKVVRFLPYSTQLLQKELMKQKKSRVARLSLFLFQLVSFIPVSSLAKACYGVPLSDPEPPERSLQRMESRKNSPLVIGSW